MNLVPTLPVFPQSGVGSHGWPPTHGGSGRTASALQPGPRAAGQCAGLCRRPGGEWWLRRSGESAQSLGLLV